MANTGTEGVEMNPVIERLERDVAVAEAEADLAQVLLKCARRAAAQPLDADD